MKYLKIGNNTTLKDLVSSIGYRNIDNALHLNGLSRNPYIGQEYSKMCKDVIKSSDKVSWQTKKAVLNTLTEDSDTFETASLLGESGWKLLGSELQLIPGYMKVPENVKLPSSVDILGNGIGVDKSTFNAVMTGLEGVNHDIDPSIFVPIDGRRPSLLRDSALSTSVGAMKAFRIPWGEVTLYSSLADDHVDFPCYPNEVSDIIRANYSQMPDMLYQYEPWMMYSSSGPRVNTYTFDIHRDMWDDHTNGKANQLVRFCQANCYPDYNGASVHSAIVSLYIGGSPIIKGIVTEVNTDWDGPLGHDKFYLHFKISLTIQEISDTPLSYTAIRNKKLIG